MSDVKPAVSSLSIIVPVLNEREELPAFCSDLARQQGIDYELLFCDGGSTDGTLEWLQQRASHQLKVVCSSSGRARQLNCGISQAQGEWLLLLHVDSRFEDPHALAHGLAYLKSLPEQNVAGHFALSFRRDEGSSEAGYYYYEWKARLGRPETIHGDQGFFLSRKLLDRVGAFNESLKVMEDTDFVERLRTVGQWHLLAHEISTSARRFEVEGLWQRQLLGALIMCFRTIGWCQYFEAAPQVYRLQTKADRLQVLPFFDLVRTLMKQLSWHKRWQLWSASGAYVRGHAWQLFFALDARAAFRSGVAVGEGQTRWLDRLLPLYDLVADNRCGRYCATLLLRVWFEIAAFMLKRQEKR